MGVPVFASSAPLPTSTMKCRRACRHAGAAIVHCCGHQTTPRTTCDDWWGDDAKHHGRAEFCISRSRTTCSRQSSISLCCAYKYTTLIPSCISSCRPSASVGSEEVYHCKPHRQVVLTINSSMPLSPSTGVSSKAIAEVHQLKD